MIKTAFGILILCIFTETALYANEISRTQAKIVSSESDQELLAELMAIVDESTSIATTTKMNSQYVPGTVTVLEGKELESLGVGTAWDAMALVPGFLPTRDPNGGTSIISRGLSFPFSSGNVKVLVNSLAMSVQSSAFNSSILQIPIEQIERIEVVRGPGAILYGDNAFMGLVNIITYSDKQQLFTRVGGNGAISGGAAGSYSNNSSQLQVLANLYAYDNNSADAPNGIFADEERQFGVFSLKYHGFSLSAQSYHRDFDPNNPGNLRNLDLVREGSDILALQQHMDITPTLNTKLRFSYLNNDFNAANQNYDGSKIKGSVDINWTGMENHNWWFKFTYTDENIDDATTLRAPQVQIGPPPPRPPGGLRPPGPPRPPPPPTALLVSDQTRKYYSLSIQDQFELTDFLTLTAGLRYDRRDDLAKDFFTPRISAVWRINDEHIIKAQYAEGFRVPTFFELYTATGRLNLKPEIIATSELNYIYHQPTHTGTITLFYSHIDDMLFLEGNSFNNAEEAESIGIEIEWKQQLFSQLKWQANLSFVDSWDTRTRDGSQAEDKASTNWLANIAVFYQPMNKVLLTTHWHYTGQRDKPGINVNAENRLNLTLNVSDLFTQGLGFKVGVQNILKAEEQDIRTNPTNSTRLGYGDGQIVWAQFSYRI